MTSATKAAADREAMAKPCIMSEPVFVRNGSAGDQVCEARPKDFTRKELNFGRMVAVPVRKHRQDVKVNLHHMVE